MDYPSNLDEMRGALTYLSQKPSLNGDRGKVWVIWGGKRDVHRIRIGGRFSDKPDTADKEGAEARRLTAELPVLLLLRQEGRESSGWLGTPFYWPVLLAPKNTKTALFNSRSVEANEDEGGQSGEDVAEAIARPTSKGIALKVQSRAVAPALYFTQKDSDAAYDNWEANCGPHAVAASCGLSLKEVRKPFKPFRGSTSPTLMQKALGALGTDFTLTKDLHTQALSNGVAYVQWEGPWLKPGALPVARYRHTHWIAVKDGWVYDSSLDPAHWIKEAQWRPRFSAEVAKKYTGWHVWQRYAF